MSQIVLMKCGHNSMAERVWSDGTRGPACFICDCYEVDDNPPVLTGRMARCHYYGKPPRRSECNYNCIPGENCSCELPSSVTLPFFEYRGPGTNHWKGEAEYDEFYCGCHSWN